MLVNLLGPIEAVTDDGAIGLGGAKQRAVLAMLALQTGSTVSADRLIDGLWGDHPPASALKLVQLYVSHLRKALGEEDVIFTHGRGYSGGSLVCCARARATRVVNAVTHGP